MSASNIQSVYIVQDDGICGGHPRIAGSRIKVQHIVIEYVHGGLSAEEICKSLPPLTPAQVHAALSFYYDHQDEIKQTIEDDQEIAEQMEAGLI